MARAGGDNSSPDDSEVGAAAPAAKFVFGTFSRFTRLYLTIDGAFCPAASVAVARMNLIVIWINWRNSRRLAIAIERSAVARAEVIRLGSVGYGGPRVVMA